MQPPQRDAARVGATATAISGTSKVAGPVSRVEHTGQGPAPMRDRLWRHLERLGQRPGRGQEAKPPGSRLDDVDAQPARLEAQLARGLAAALKQREGHVTLRLTPETLGKLRIDLNITDDRVTAQIAASTEQARRLLKENVVSLRTALEATGLGVDRIEVVGAPAEPATQPPPANAPAAGDAAPSMAWNGGAGEGGGQAPDGRGQARHGPASGPSDGDAGGSGTTGMELTEYGYVLRVDFLA
ncbi:MAG: flagellar hook-length control protein FliK [Phycisphaerales bacterium]|nr:flagellar hook-length control protein FliK [Phycisphaerales bacterium]